MKYTKLIRTLYTKFLKPILFLTNPERAHDKITLLGWFFGNSYKTKAFVRKILHFEDSRLAQTVSGIKFSNPVGLSAGFDKDANLPGILSDVGFGYMQIGSVTWKPYKGNPKPRLYRLPKSEGLVVYYGLKNIGVRRIIEKLKSFKNSKFPLSISVAKTNSDETSTLEGGIEDYYQCLKELNQNNIGDFFTINISCPNTFGGEPFTTPETLELLLNRLDQLEISKPIYVKMPLNHPWADFKQLLDVIVDHKLDGVIIANLQKDRNVSSIKDRIPERIQGGISGKPTRDWSNELIFKTYREYGEALKIVGVGGIFNAMDAYEKIRLGASLVQLITGMVYEGPQLIGEINKGLIQLIEKDGYSLITDVIGTAHRNG